MNNPYMNSDSGNRDASADLNGRKAYEIGSIGTISDFDPAKDVLDLGSDSIHNQIGVDTADGFALVHMFDSNKTTLIEGVFLKDLTAANFRPIADAHLQQDLSASLAFENGTGLVRENTVYVRSHEAGLVETVDFNPATDTLSMFYLSVRGDQGLNFVAEDTAEGARFFSPITGQSLTLRGVSLGDLDSSHFEWRANQIEDNVAGRMGLADQIDGFTYDNIYSGKSVPMAGLVDRAPYHSQPEYTGRPIGDGPVIGDTPGDDTGGGESSPIIVAVTGGSVTEGDPGMIHMHGDGTSHVHDDGHRFIIFDVSLDTPATDEVTLNYETRDGLAVADTTNSVAWDYHETTGTLNFLPGEQTKTVAVAVHPDNLVELTETFTLRVSGENISGDLVATGIIYDNDTAAPTDGDMNGDGMDGDMAGDMQGDDMSGGDMDAGDAGGDMGDDGSADGEDDSAVSFDTSNQWGDGFIAAGVFTPEVATNGWTISFTSTAEITNIWNAEIVSKVGNVYTIENASYNGDVAAGQEISFGFQARGNDATISGVVVNGDPVETDDTAGDDMSEDMDAGDAGGDMDAGDAGGDMGDNGSGGDDDDMGAGNGAVSFDTGNQWGDGFIAAGVFTPEVATNGWTISFTSTADITNIWNAEIVSKVGNVYTIENASYNGDVAAGQEISFGFQARGNDATISGVVVNGDPVETDDTADGDMSDDMDAGDANGDMGGGDAGGQMNDDTGDIPAGNDTPVDTPADMGGNTGGNVPGGGDILNGPLSTVGTDIVDRDGTKVDLKGVNWFGFETDLGAPHGLWARNMEAMLDDIAEFGFNMIRLPFSGELAANDRAATGINLGENPMLAGLTSHEIMGEFLDAAAERGIGVLLDMHRQTVGDGAEAGGTIPDIDAFKDQWVAMADLFGDHPAVIGFDLYNEPHGYSWDEWAGIAEEVGNMLLESNPDELIIVEGVETYQGESHWWGGNLKGVADRPIELNADNKLVYSPHEYATSVFEQPYFTEAGYDAKTSLPQIFRENWGFVEEEGIAPLLLGEFGSKFENQIDKDWGPVLSNYLVENDIDWSVWSWNPNSGDTGGVVQDDWETAREEAFTYLLDPLLSEGAGDNANGAFAMAQDGLGF